MRNGIMLMGAAALAALWYTHGDVSKLVVMYAINVFVTFSLSNIAMSVYWIRRRKEDASWAKHLPAHVVASALCVTILVVTIIEKLLEGAWLTLLITSLLISLCFAVKRHYLLVGKAIQKLDRDLPGPEQHPAMYAATTRPLTPPDPEHPVAILLVGGYGGLGRHALLALLRMFPGQFRGVVFISVAVVDSDVFKGASELPALEERTRKNLGAYERFGAALGLACASEFAVGTEVALEAEKLALGLAERYPRALVVGGQLVFTEDSAWNRLLHNETAFVIQRRLQHNGVPMIVLPVQLDLSLTRDYLPKGALRAGVERLEHAVELGERALGVGSRPEEPSPSAVGE